MMNGFNFIKKKKRKNRCFTLFLFYTPSNGQKNKKGNFPKSFYKRKNRSKKYHNNRTVHRLLLSKRAHFVPVRQIEKGLTTMSEKRKLAVLGGDLRQVYMAKSLAEMGYEVFVWGLGACSEEIGRARLCSSWEEAVSISDAVILPLPASADGVRVHCPLQSEDVFLRVPALMDAMGDKLLLGGRFTEALCSIADQKGIRYFDYFDSEVLQLKNALPTAEGAIAIAMRELPVTLYGTHAVILGYGRIGSLLGERLSALGAHVTVYARRIEQRTLAALHSHAVRRLHCKDGAADIPQDCRVIFNTVPHRILPNDALSRLSSRCVLIDLASAPGGYDHAFAASLGLRTVWGTALPGKCTPESAGIILAETLSEILSETNTSM